MALGGEVLGRRGLIVAMPIRLCGVNAAQNKSISSDNDNAPITNETDGMGNKLIVIGRRPKLPAPSICSQRPADIGHRRWPLSCYYGVADIIADAERVIGGRQTMPCGNVTNRGEGSP